MSGVKSHWLPSAVKRLVSRKTARWLGMTLAGISVAMAVNEIRACVTRPTEYRIAVVGIENDRIWSDLEKGVNDYRKEINSTLKKLNVTVQTISHEGDLEEAERLAKELIADGSVVGVILAGTSSQADQLLEHYRGDKPVLVAQATNPSLTLHDNVFRLPPNDRKQVDTLAQFAREKHREIAQAKQSDTTVAIYRDHTNEEYAGYIAGRLREILEGLSVSQAAKISVVAYGEVGGHDEGVYLELVNLRPDVLFYAGNCSSLLPLIHQAADRGAWQPTLVLTNGCVDSVFLNRAEGSFESAYATFPVIPRDQQGNSSSGGIVEPSYERYGSDALMILVDVIKESLGFDPGSGEELKAGVIKPEKLVEGLKRGHFEGMASNYGFKNSENTEGHYHVFRAVRDVAANTWRWKHSPYDCPVVDQP